MVSLKRSIWGTKSNDPSTEITPWERNLATGMPCLFEGGHQREISRSMKNGVLPESLKKKNVIFFFLKYLVLYQGIVW